MRGTNFKHNKFLEEIGMFFIRYNYAYKIGYVDGKNSSNYFKGYTDGYREAVVFTVDTYRKFFDNPELRSRGGDNKMAYDVTALTTAIAEGKVEEVAARQLIADYYDWEIKVAQLLTPSAEGAAVESVADAAPVEEVATETVDLAQEAQPESEQTETQV